MNVSVSTLLLPGILSSVTADFTKNSADDTVSCSVFDGSQVTFNPTNGTVNPATPTVINGFANSVMQANAASPTLVVQFDDEIQYPPISFDPKGLYRLNFSCPCQGDDPVILGSYNRIVDSTIEHSIKAFNAATFCQKLLDFPLGLATIYNTAVYNTNGKTYIAVLTEQSGTYVVHILSYTPKQSPSPWDPITEIDLTKKAAYKVQWYPGEYNTAWVAIDTAEQISIYQVDLGHSSLGHTLLHTANKASDFPSNFLYWLPQSDGLYLIQGFNTTTVATYKVDLKNSPSISEGHVTNLNSAFTMCTTCATCKDYLVIGGQDINGGLLARYTVDPQGLLVRKMDISVAHLDSIINYCEKCCCPASNHLLIGTESGLYSVDASTFDQISSTDAHRKVINLCWCCDNANPNSQLCAIVTDIPDAYLLQEVYPSFTDLCRLQNPPNN